MAKAIEKRKRPYRNHEDVSHKKRRFLVELERGYTIVNAAKKARLSLQDVYQWRREDMAFEAEWHATQERVFDNLEGEVLKAASQASTGLPGAATCAMFLLKAKNPMRYCDRARAMKIQAEIDAQREKAALDEADAETWNRVLTALDTIAAQKRALAGPDA